jgi:hypothetical protein
MKLDYLEPRHIRQLPTPLLAQTIKEYRQALGVLERNPAVGSERLQDQFRNAIRLLEEELARRSTAPDQPEGDPPTS